MARIVTNSLLSSTKRVIENYKSDFRTSDGPQTSAFVSLSDLAIPYDSHYVSRLVLPAYTKDYLLKYGELEEVTFLLIKVTYNGNYDNIIDDSFDPLYSYEPNNYNISYYFEDNTGVTYPINRLLVLNGSFNNKIKKIYLNNLLDYDVSLNILSADIDAPIFVPPSSAITITNLYYNDIITDQLNCSTSISGLSFTGSTQFSINEYVVTSSGYTKIQHNIPFYNIVSIQSDSNIIYFYTIYNKYTLKFLTESDYIQAYCRITFAYTSYSDDSCRYLTDNESYKNNESVICSTP